MTALPESIYSVASVREIDRVAIEDNGFPGYTLMQRAAEAAFADALSAFRDPQRVQVLCGAGNNAGDGYVYARLAMQEGLGASVLALLDPQQLNGDARRAADDYVAAGGSVDAWDGALDSEADLLVDALLGSGLDRDVGGDFAAVVNAINDHPAPVHALDLPSGLHGDTGRTMGVAVNADMTTTFVGLKSGLFLDDGPDRCGQLGFSDLGIPAGWHRSVEPTYRRVVDDALATALAPRDRAAHKGDFGHVLVVGGGPGMPGAAQLCGSAALRSGAGRVTLATHPEHAATIAAARPELMVQGIDKVDALLTLLEHIDVVAFGPGLGGSDWARSIYDALASVDRVAVWDADALNLLAEKPARSRNRIITPHPGEAARLLGSSARKVQENRLASLSGLVQRYGGTVVLKGAGSLVSAGRGAPFLCTDGNPGMAAPGMGDALTGIIAALLAQGMSPEQAAAIGVGVHASAGDLAAEQGERGLLASDLIDMLPWIVNP